jgi:hypothetical protein
MVLERPQVSEKKNTLDFDDAYAEAHFIQSKLQEMVGHDPTPEDYDRALQAVDEVFEQGAKATFADAVRICSKYFQWGVQGFVKAMSTDASEEILKRLRERATQADRKNNF